MSKSKVAYYSGSGVWSLHEVSRYGLKHWESLLGSRHEGQKEKLD